MHIIEKLLLNKLIKNHFVLLISLIQIEVIFRVVSNLSFVDWSILRIFIGLNIISLFFSSVIYFFKKTVEKILMITFIFIFSFYAFIQTGFNNFLGLYMSFGTSAQATAVKEYISDYFRSFSIFYYILFLPFLLSLFYYIFIEKKVFALQKNSKLHQKNLLKNKYLVDYAKIFLIFVLLCSMYYASLSVGFMQNKLQIRSNKSLFMYPSLTNVAVTQFGINAYLFIDVKSMFFNEDETNTEQDEYTYKEQKVTDYTRVFDDSLWQKMIEKEQNTVYQKLNNYYISKEITPKNEYTGYFEGKNLIIIMMESVNDIILDEKYFPTIHKMYTEGWNFTNHYSPRNSCSTGNNEMSAMVSLFSINSSCTANKYRNNTYFESIFNVFNSQEYVTSSYHNYTSAYYYRDTIHTNMGSGKYYDAIDLKISYESTYKEWPSDIDLMEKSFDKYINEDKFMVWMTTVTSHQPYSVSSKMGDLHLNLFKDTGYPTSLKRYMSKLKELDLSLEVLLKKLEEVNKLDDTVIVLFADHYPYGLNTNVLQEYFDYDISLNNEKDRTPFIIYNPKIESKIFEQYTTNINLLPTLTNLFNLSYDPRLYAGSDVFSDNYENIAVFADGSWQSPIGFYNARTGKMYYNGEEIYADEEIIKINENINARITLSNLSITSNYFSYLKKALDETKKAEETAFED